MLNQLLRRSVYCRGEDCSEEHQEEAQEKTVKRGEVVPSDALAKPRAVVVPLLTTEIADAAVLCLRSLGTW